MQLQELEKSAGSNPDKLNAAAQFALQCGDRMRTSHPEVAFGFFASALELSLRALSASKSSHADDLAQFSITNSALLQLISMEDDPKKSSRIIQTPLGTRTLDVKSVFSTPDNKPLTFERIRPAELIELFGFTYRMALPGFGVPLVGIRHITETTPPRIIPGINRFAGDHQTSFHLARGTFTPITAVPTFANDTFTIELLNPKQTLTTLTPAGRAPLAADFTAPIALFFDRLNDLALGIRGLLRVDRQMAYAGLYMLEPYDPDRIPVVMVHGLSSSPLIWRNLINDLTLDPVIRRNYQFWVVYYPSGIPTMASAFFLRDRLAAVRETFDPAGKHRASRDLVSTGHSMGGVITRMNATQIGDRLWQTISDVPFEQVNLTPEDRALIKPRLFWEPIPQLRRSVYFSAPHRGALLADSSLANIGMRLIRFPNDIFQFQKRMLNSLTHSLSSQVSLTRLTTSIGSLSPTNPVFVALDGAPFKDDYRYHSVIGDRGRGDTPESSDGIVGYWSSHLPSAESELIVPTGHESFSHPDAIEKTRQVLRTHLQE